MENHVFQRSNSFNGFKCFKPGDKQKETQSKIILVEENGKYIRCFVDHSMSENAEHYLIVNVNQLLKLNNAWICKSFMIGAGCVVGLVFVLNSIELVSLGFEKFNNFHTKIQKLFDTTNDTNYLIKRLRNDIDAMDTRERTLLNKVTMIESWVNNQRSNPRF